MNQSQEKKIERKSILDKASIVCGPISAVLLFASGIPIDFRFIIMYLLFYFYIYFLFRLFQKSYL